MEGEEACGRRKSRQTKTRENCGEHFFNLFLAFLSFLAQTNQYPSHSAPKHLFLLSLTDSQSKGRSANTGPNKGHTTATLPIIPTYLTNDGTFNLTLNLPSCAHPSHPPYLPPEPLAPRRHTFQTLAPASFSPFLHKNDSTTHPKLVRLAAFVGSSSASSHLYLPGLLLFLVC